MAKFEAYWKYEQKSLLPPCLSTSIFKKPGQMEIFKVSPPTTHFPFFLSFVTYIFSPSWFLLIMIASIATTLLLSALSVVASPSGLGYLQSRAAPDNTVQITSATNYWCVFSEFAYLFLANCSTWLNVQYDHASVSYPYRPQILPRSNIPLQHSTHQYRR